MRAQGYEDSYSIPLKTLYTKRDYRTPFVLSLLLVLLVSSSVLPQWMSALVQLITVFSAVLVTVFIPKAHRRAPSSTVWAWLIIFYWFLLIFLPNIPELAVGVIGFRKTVFCLFGLILASAIPQLKVRAVERTTVIIVIVSLTISLGLFLFFPTLEASMVDRDAADIYTGLFDGAARLQGIFSGPFHVAVGSLILIIWGVTRFQANKFIAILAVFVGGVCLNFTNVRTAYVALALALLSSALVARSASRVVKRLIGIAALVLIAFYLMIQFFPERMQFFIKIINFEGDTRFTGRLDGYSYGFDMFFRSPLWGWGAGAAGDTMGPLFGSGEHITSHNLLLKIAVEGGLIGVLLWGAFFISMFRHLPRSISSSSTAIGLLVVLLGMGLTGSAVEGLPLTFILFFFVGLYLKSRPYAPFLPLDLPVSRSTAEGKFISEQRSLK